MALDLWVMGDDRRLTKPLALGVEDHWAIIQAAQSRESFPLIGRLQDYYADAAFALDEVALLRNELRRLDAVGGTAAAATAELSRLCDRALAKGQGIEAIAD
jgi:hypothetical protein